MHFSTWTEFYEGWCDHPIRRSHHPGIDRVNGLFPRFGDPQVILVKIVLEF